MTAQEPQEILFTPSLTAREVYYLRKLLAETMWHSELARDIVEKLDKAQEDTANG